MPRRTLGSLLLVLAALQAMACGASPTAASHPEASAPAKAAPPPAANLPKPASPGHLLRPSVDAVLKQYGPGWVFSRHVLVEEVLGPDGRFIGWRLARVPEEWVGFDLQPGDVVTQVNEHSVKQPEDAWEVWKLVAKSPEIRVQLTRDGIARKVVIPIDGPVSEETARVLERGPTAPSESTAQPERAPTRSQPRESIPIGGPAKEGDAEVY